MQQVFVFFVGLIVHMDLKHSTTAVLVAASRHTYTMTIFRADGTVVPAKDITDMYITLNRSGASLSTSRTRIKHRVPELKDLESGCTPRIPIVNRDPDGAVAAYVDYEGGMLKPMEDEKTRIHFPDAPSSSFWKECHCTSCRTELDVNIPIGGSMIITLAPVADKANVTVTESLINGDTVVFRDAMPKGAAAPGNHSGLVFGLLENAGNPCIPHDVLIDCPGCTGGLACDDPSETQKAIDKKVERGRNFLPWKAWSPATRADFVTTIVVPTVDCSNSQYP